MKDGFPTTLAVIGIALLGLSALGAEPTPEPEPMVQDVCKRRVILADCLRNHPTKVKECEREATDQSWAPQSQVPPVCRGMV